MKKQGKWIWLTPVLLALPFIAAVGAAAALYGPTLQNLVSVAINLAVTK